MLFNSSQFFLFLIAVLALFYSASAAWRKAVLLAASYFFYMCWIPKYALVLVALTAIDYTAARWIERTSVPFAEVAAGGEPDGEPGAPGLLQIL
jgi:hypothetical protein